MNRIVKIGLLVCCVSFGSVFAQPPRVINYQGKLFYDDAPLTGGYYIKYELDDDTLNSPEYRWSQEPTSAADSVWVQDGLFSDTLGLWIDTVLSAYPTLYLRVYIKKNFSDSWTYLGSERLLSAPYALVTFGVTSCWADSEGYITNTNASSDATKVRITDEGNLGVCVSNPDDKLDVNGSVDLNSNMLKNVKTPTSDGGGSVGYGVSTAYLLGTPKSTTSHFKLYNH